MRNLGYSVNYMILNASDFDVPQAPERISIFVLTNNLDLIFLLLKQIFINFTVESLTN